MPELFDTQAEMLADNEALQKKQEKSQRAGSYASDIIKLVSGTTFAQILTVLASPVLTRLFTPKDFGIFTLYLSILDILTVVACLRYELAIMLPKEDGEAANLFTASLFFTTLISLLTIPLIWLGGDLLVDLLNSPGLARYLWWIPPSVFFAGLFLALNYWDSRRGRYDRLSVRRVINSLLNIVLQVAAGLTRATGAGGLVGGYFGGSALSTLILSREVWRDNRALFLQSVRLSSIIEGLKRYRKFPLYDTWSALFNSLARQLPNFLLSAFFFSTVVGYYGVAYRVLRLPMMLVGTSINQVFYQRAAQARNDGTLPEVVDGTFRRLVVFGMFPMLLLMLAGQEIFAFAFGAVWAEAGVYAQILSLATFFIFITSPLTGLMSVFEKQEIGLVFNITLLATRAASFVIGGLLNDARLALGLYTATTILEYGWLSVWLNRVAQISVLRSLRHLGRNFALCLPFLALVAAAKWLLLVSAFQLLLISCVSGVAYYLIALRRDQTLQETLVFLFKRYGLFEKLQKIGLFAKIKP